MKEGLTRRNFVKLAATAGVTMGIAGAGFTLSGCSGDAQKAGGEAKNGAGQSGSTKTTYPLTLENFKTDGASYTAENATFAKAPTKVFAATQGSAETLCMLGLQGAIVGTANKTSEPVSEIASAYSGLNLVTKDYANREQMMSTDPDFVIGRGAIFSETQYGVGTTSSLHDTKIDTWVLRSSAPNSKVDDLYRDITDIGKIFDVQEKAESWAKELEERMTKVDKVLGDISDERTYLYLVNARSGNGYMIFSGPQTSQQEDAFGYLGLKNAATEVKMDAVSAENILAYNPDVIFAINYTPGNTTAAQGMIDNLKANASLATLPAVVKDEFYIIEYNDIFSFSFRMVNGVEKLAKEMYPDKLG